MYSTDYTVYNNILTHLNGMPLGDFDLEIIERGQSLDWFKSYLSNK